MLVYFIVMNDYGFKPHSLIFLNLQKGFFPEPTDVYDPFEPNFGNSNWGNMNKYGTLSWGTSYQTKMDARLFYTSLNKGSFSRCRWDPYDEDVPEFWRISKFSDT